MAIPSMGEVVRDTAIDRVGVVMAHEGPYMQLRPLGGGCEWDANPQGLEPISQPDLLSARVAEVNLRSRTGDGK